jgi:ATP-dependent DNA ligase
LLRILWPLASNHSSRLIPLGSAPARAVEERKQHLAWALLERRHGIRLNATYDGDGAMIYEHACTLGCEGIVSNRLGSPYCAGRTDQWLKMKNPKAPALRRERETGGCVAAAMRVEVR